MSATAHTAHTSVFIVMAFLHLSFLLVLYYLVMVTFFSDDEKVKEWNFQNATTLIITFIVNNHVNESQNAMAEAWEKAYLDYLKNYKGEYFNISFLAEVRLFCVTSEKSPVVYFGLDKRQNSTFLSRSCV